MRKIACSIIIISISFYSIAQTQVASTNVIQSNAATTLARESNNKVFGAVSVGHSSNLYERTAVEAEASTSADLVLNYKISGPHLIRSYLAGSQRQTKGKETRLKDGYVAWVNDRFWFQNKTTTIGQHIRMIVPASKESRLRDERLTGVTVAPIAIINLTPMGLTGVMLAYQPAATKNFHKYEQNRIFQTNNEYSLNQLIRIAWNFTDTSYLMSDFIYRNSWSYGGVRKDDSSTYNIEVGRTFKGNLNWGVGVTTDATIRNFENGTDESISLFNKNKSSVYTDLTYLF
jgi:hypothetical protein